MNTESNFGHPISIKIQQN